MYILVVRASYSQYGAQEQHKIVFTLETKEKEEEIS
jgi:hypothetical protein